MTDIGYVAAFLGGLLALLSPCSALLLPAFFAYSLDSTGRLLARTGIFYLGLATTLVPLGVAGSFAGRLFYGNRDVLVAVGGWLIIALGVFQLLGLGFVFRPLQRASGRIRPSTAVSVYALGAVYGLAGFCAGPILGSVLAVAAVGGNPVYGGLLLAVYALGMAVPLFLLAALWERFDLGRRRWLRGRELRVGRLRLHTTSLLSGGFFILLGVVFLRYDGTSGLSGLMDVNSSFAAERWAERVGQAVPDMAVLLALLGVAAAILLVRHFRREDPADPAEAPATDSTDGPADRDGTAEQPDAAGAAPEHHGAPGAGAGADGRTGSPDRSPTDRSPTDRSPTGQSVTGQSATDWSATGQSAADEDGEAAGSEAGPAGPAGPAVPAVPEGKRQAARSSAVGGSRQPKQSKKSD